MKIFLSLWTILIIETRTMKQITIFLSCIFLLISCGRPDSTVLEETSTWIFEKQEFFIETKTLDSFSSSYEIKKVWTLSSNQIVTLNSNASGRISSLSVKEWDAVKNGQVIATLADNISNFEIGVDRANNAIARAKINYDSQKISLDKQVVDAELELEKLWQNIVNLQKTNAQNIARSQNDQDNINANENIQKIDLNVERINQNIIRLEQNIENLKFDLENLKLNNEETLSGFKTRIFTEHNAIEILLDDIIQFSDEILGVTPENEDENEDFDQFLWIEDNVQRWVSESSLRNTIAFKQGEFKTLVPENPDDMTDDQLVETISGHQKWYALLKILLENLEVTFQNSIPSIGSLSEADIDAFEAQINGFQAQMQWWSSTFSSVKSQIETFLRTYENDEESTSKQIDLLENDKILLEKDKQILINDRDLQEKNLDIAQKNSELWIDSVTTQWIDAIINLENQIALTQLSFENAKANRAVTLQSLDNQIAEANINYNQAIKEREKLTIYAPISGTVSSVSVDVWEEVSPGGQILNIQNTSNTEIVIWLSDEELDLIKTGLKVSVLYDGVRVWGKITSVSDIADANLNFKTTVELDKPIDRLGKLVEVYIPVTTKNILVPLNIVEINGNGTEGVLNTYSESDSVSFIWVKIGNNYGSNIEITACENPQILWEEESEETEKFITCSVFEKTEVIISNMNNYDESKFKIVVK